MSHLYTPSRRHLLLGGTGAAALLAGAPGWAAADSDGPGRKGYGAPSDLLPPRNVHGDGGPVPPGGMDSDGFPLPKSADALPERGGKARAGLRREDVVSGIGRSHLSAARAGGDTTQLAASSVPNYYATEFPTLRPGSGMLLTRALQYLLLSAGHETNWEKTYGSSTTAAVKAYQRQAGLTVSGNADPATLERLAKHTYAGDQGNRVYAVQTLLRRHGYLFYDYDAPSMSSNYGPITTKYVRAFQAGHGIAPNTFVGYYTWRTLFAAPTSKAMYPLLQYQTGDAQWANCGPVSAVTLLIHRGVRPREWGWNTALRRPAVENFRYDAMGVANTASRDEEGTEFPDFKPAFESYGITPWHGGINDTITNAKKGLGSIAGGDANELPWANYVNGPVSHWVAVLGWDGKYFLVMDPISKTTSDEIHRLTEAQLRNYAATNPGHPASTAAKNSIMLP